MAVRRARTMPVQDDLDRCGRCGKVIKKTDRAGVFVDTRYDRTVRTDPRCTSVLRQTAGYREIVT